MIRKQSKELDRSMGQRGEQLKKLVATISGRCGGFASAPMLSMDGALQVKRGLFISKTATGSGVVAFLAGQWKTG